MARILVVDDDKDVRDVVQTMLAAGGHDVVLAADGDAGIQRFREQRFDLVLCDFHMPGKTGPEVVDAIRQISRDVPIVSMTGSSPRDSGGAHVDPAFLASNGKGGATTFIGKPFRGRQLLAIVDQCLASAATVRDE